MDSREVGYGSGSQAEAEIMKAFSLVTSLLATLNILPTTTIMADRLTQLQDAVDQVCNF